jgi:hypothetical protein
MMRSLRAATHRRRAHCSSQGAFPGSNESKGATARRILPVPTLHVKSAADRQQGGDSKGIRSQEHWMPRKRGGRAAWSPRQTNGV